MENICDEWQKTALGDIQNTNQEIHLFRNGL